MGKRRNKRKVNSIRPGKSSASVNIDSDDSDTSVTTTLSGFTSIGAELYSLDVTSFTNNLDEVAAELNDKRTETRIKAFNSLNELLCRRCCTDWIESRFDQIIKTIHFSLKRSCTSPDTAAECTVVSRTLGLVALSLDSSTVDNIFENFYSIILTALAHNNHRTACKSLCDVLNVICICKSGHLGFEKVMNDLQDLWMKEDRLIENRASILHAWYVCLSRTSNQGAMIKANVHVLLDLVDLLESDCIGMRVNAAECITLFICIYRDLEGQTVLDDWDIELESGVTLEELVETFNGFTADRRSAPKKQLVGQRKKFRILLDTLENQEPPEIAFNIRKEKCSIVGCSQVIQADAVRKILRNGFQAHLIDNKRIQARFHLGDLKHLLESRKHESKEDKHAHKVEKALSKKDWQKRRSAQRNFKQAMFATSI